MPSQSMPWWMRIYGPQRPTFQTQSAPLAATGGGQGFPSEVLGPQPPPNIPQFGGGDPTEPTGIPIEPQNLLPPPNGAGGSVTPGELVNPPSEAFPPGSNIPSSAYPPSGVTPPGQGNRGDDSGVVPGVDLSPRDRINMLLHNAGLPTLPTDTTGTPQERAASGQDVDPFSGTGGPGDYNPYGPGGSPGTRGIVSPNSPAGGGSFFGGSGSPTVLGGGNLGNLGGGGSGYGGNLMAALLLHGTGMQNWAQSQGYKNVGDWISKTGFTLPGTRSGSGAGIGGAGRPPTQALQGGGVVEPSTPYAVDENSPPSRIGQAVYNVGRKSEDIFHALGELGKYLTKSPDPQPWGNAIAPPSARDYLLGPNPPPWGQPANRGGLSDFMMGPRPASGAENYSRASGMRLAGLGGVYDPEFPPWGFRGRTGPWPIKQEPMSEGTYRPEMYDKRASGALMAWRGAVVPSAMTRSLPRPNMATNLTTPTGGSTDTVPAMLTPGEVVLNHNQQGAVMPVPGKEHLLRRDQLAALGARMWK